MSSGNTTVHPSIIEDFLNGRNPQKYVVAIEANYHEPFVNLVINEPGYKKRIEKATYEPFLWFKHEVLDLLYKGNKVQQLKEAKLFGIRTKKLKTSDFKGNVPKRLQNGYKYLAICNKSYNDLVLFFKNGGVDVFSKEHSKKFFMFTPVEQYMIQSGVRLFKGMDDYNDLHRFQFDLETEGLLPEKNEIFQIGMRDNRGFEYVLETTGNTLKERRESEKENIKKFFKVINKLKPDIITGYNSESFDWDFIFKRAARLYLNLDDEVFGLDGKSKLKRKPSILKLGNEMESYEQTYLYGYNIIDIAHSVRRAQAINSDIKAWNLKYITKYSEIAKKNRVYVPGDKIHTIWSDVTNLYAFNDINGDWYKISDRMPLRDGYEEVNGNYIIQRYLLDDLWETENIDTIFNQAAFLISKLLPTTYSRSSTMGTAGQWKLIMSAWSYENNLAIPENEPKRDFTGGLSRLLEVGYAKNVVKLDYAALYPKNQLTHKIFPDLDISGVMEGMLTYVVDTRDKFKFLTGKHKGIVKKLAQRIEKEKDTLSNLELEELKEELKKNKALVGLYDKKQLPLKILANSWFGAYGAPYIFNWGDSDCAEETTCRGRQYLRLMVKHFSEKYKFKPLVGDTDGFNFAFPDNIDEIKYVAKGTHWKTEENKDVELFGLEAVLAEFNEEYMIGRMGLDIDDICNSTLNFSRKNYANDIGGKIKFVGNSIKSKKMPVFIEDFLNKAIRMLLDGRGKNFINYYYEYVDIIYNHQIPLVKIASKSKVKSSISDYKAKSNKKNKAGNPMPKQAHMELAIRSNLNVNLGDTLYYVNTGDSKTKADLKTLIKSKMTKKQLLDYEIKNGHPPKFETEVQINCKLIDPSIVETNLEIIKEIESLNKMLLDADEKTTEKINLQIQEAESQLLKEEYNVAKYLEAFNNKVEPLLVCFHPDIRNKIILEIKKDKKNRVEKLTERFAFTDSQCKLVSGMPDNPEEQDTYEDLMKMEDKEIKFWDKVNKTPNNISEDEWLLLRDDYKHRMVIEAEEELKREKELFNEIIKKLEYDDLINIKTKFKIPSSLLVFNMDDSGNFLSRKSNIKVGTIFDVFNHEEEAIERYTWYQRMNLDSKDRYEQWLEYITENSIEEKGVHFESTVLLEENIELIKKNITETEKKSRKKKNDIEIVDDNEIEDENESENESEDDNNEFNDVIEEPEFDAELIDSTSIEEPKVFDFINNPMEFIRNIKNMPDDDEDEWNF